MSASSVAPSPPSRGLHVGLWVVQGLLAFAFLASGAMKLFTPLADLATKMAWVPSAGEPLVRFIGASEVLGALGLVLPSLTRIQPGLTALAGAALALVMVLGAGTHLAFDEARLVPVNVVLGGLAVFVAWGRFSRSPIAPR